MDIIVNGQTKETPENENLQNIILQLSGKPELVIAELNGTIIQKQDWPKTVLRPNDKLELVTFVGGG